MNTYLFIAVCILAIITVLLYTFVSSAIHKRDLCRKSPYYFCDTDWLCCKNKTDGSGNPILCDIVPGGPVVTGNDANAYFLTDQLYGSNKGTNPSGLDINMTPCVKNTITTKTYFDACIEPVKLITAHYNIQNLPVPSGALECLYETTCSGADSTIFNTDFKNIEGLSDLEIGQCCYKPFDPTPANTNNQIGNSQAYYPSSVSSNPVWDSLSVYKGNYNSSSGYVYAPKNQDTTNHSCFNTFYGGPTSVSNTTAYGRYFGCPGNTS
jgi:hypothetical protein